MERTVTATEAKNRLGSILQLVSKDGDVVVIENRREATAIIISPEQYQEYLELRKEKERREALEVLRRYQQTYATANSDLREADIEQLAERTSQEVVAALVDSGKIRFGKP